jgi:hypothetical protein
MPPLKSNVKDHYASLASIGRKFNLTTRQATALAATGVLRTLVRLRIGPPPLFHRRRSPGH